MNRTFFLMLTVGLCALAGGAAYGQEGELEGLKSRFDSLRLDLVDTRNAEVKDSEDRYAQALGGMIQKSQAAGDLETLIVLMKEKQRFDVEKPVVPDGPSGLDSLDRLQEAYETSVDQVESNFSEKHAALVESYVRKLDAMKKQLTIDGALQEALAVKAEITRVEGLKALPAGAQGRRAKAACHECGGARKVSDICSSCDGKRSCQRCGGSGVSPTVGLGGENKICLTCRGKKTCSACGGSGEQDVPCPACSPRKASGADASKLKTGLPAKVPDLPPVSPAPQTRSEEEKEDARRAFLERHRKIRESRTENRSSTNIAQEMDAYREVMQALDGAFDEGRINIVQFQDVMKNPDAYVGRLCRADVRVVGAYVRGIIVSAPLAGAENRVLIPRNLDVGTAAASVFEKKPSGVMAIATFGVVSADNLTLYKITPL